MLRERSFHPQSRRIQKWEGAQHKGWLAGWLLGEIGEQAQAHEGHRRVQSGEVLEMWIAIHGLLRWTREREREELALSS